MSLLTWSNELMIVRCAGLKLMIMVIIWKVTLSCPRCPPCCPRCPHLPGKPSLSSDTSALKRRPTHHRHRYCRHHHDNDDKDDNVMISLHLFLKLPLSSSNSPASRLSPGWPNSECTWLQDGKVHLSKGWLAWNHLATWHCSNLLYIYLSREGS